MPALIFPITVVRLHRRELLVGKAHQVKPLFCPAVAPSLAYAFSDTARQTVCLFVNFLHYSVGYLVRLHRLYAKSQPIYLSDSPHFETVRHIPNGAFHSSAGGCGYGDRLLSAHLRQRPVNHPPSAEVIEKAHHLTCGMVYINRAFQYQQITVKNRRNKGLQFFIIRAVGLVIFETGITAKA